MSYLTRLKSKKHPPKELPKPTKGGSVSNVSTQGRHFSEISVEAFPPGVTLGDVQREAGADWQKIQGCREWLEILAEAIYCRRLREMGEVPPSYTAQRYCEHCGPVMLEPWNPKGVAGCPWCVTRRAGQ